MWCLSLSLILLLDSLCCLLDDLRPFKEGVMLMPSRGYKPGRLRTHLCRESVLNAFAASTNPVVAVSYGFKAENSPVILVLPYPHPRVTLLLLALDSRPVNRKEVVSGISTERPSSPF